jgi:hypothetical protein
MRATGWLIIILLTVALVGALLYFFPHAPLEGLITGVFALLGVLITAEWGRAQFEKRLAEDRAAVSETRKFNGKQEALMQASEAILRWIMYASTLSDRDLPAGGQNTPEAENVALALNKLHFYCDLATIEVAIKLSGAFNEAFLRMMQAKMPSMFLQVELNTLNSQIDGYQKLIVRLDEQVIALLGHDPNHPTLGFVRGQIGDTHRMMGEQYGRASGLFRKKYEAVEACRDAVLSEMRTLQPLAVELMVAARRELQFPIDASSYERLMTEQSLRAMEVTVDTIRKIREEMERKFTPAPPPAAPAYIRP